MVVAHLLIVLLCVGMCLRSLVRTDTHLLHLALFGALGIIHGLVPLFLPRLLWEPRFTEASRGFAAWYAFAGIAFLAIGAEMFHMLRRNDTRAQALRGFLQTREGKRILRRVFWLSAVLGCLGWMVYFLSAGVSVAEYTTSTRFEFRFQRSNMMMWCGIYLAAFSFAPGFLGFFINDRYRLLGLCFAVTISLATFFFLYKGTRHIPMGMLGAAVFAYTYCSKPSPKKLMWLTAGLSVGLFAAVSLYNVRRSMSSLSFTEIVHLGLSGEAFTDAMVRDPLNYHQHFVGAVDFFPAMHPYTDAATYRRMLFFFLPADQFPNLKPEHPARIYAEVVYGDIYRSELNAVHPPSMLGDAYINFHGWPGVLMMFVNGVILSYVGWKVRSSLTWFLAIGPHLAWFVLLAPRGSPYEFFIKAIFLFVSVSVSARLIGASLRRASKQIDAIAAELARKQKTHHVPGLPPKFGMDRRGIASS